MTVNSVTLGHLKKVEAPLPLGKPVALRDIPERSLISYKAITRENE